MTTKEALKEIYNGMSNNIGFVKEFKNIEQALTELEELKEMFKLQSYHFMVEIKSTSYEKAKIYSQYQNEIKRYKELFYKLKGKC